MFMATTAELVAAPVDGVVTGGAAEIIQKGSAISIHQTSDRAIIDWKGFSIGAGERVDFSQPTARAAVLNRVTGSEASDIRGTLTASGRVFLMNPNGIVIGASGVIDTTRSSLPGKTSRSVARRLGFRMRAASQRGRATWFW